MDMSTIFTKADCERYWSILSNAGPGTELPDPVPDLSYIVEEWRNGPAPLPPNIKAQLNGLLAEVRMLREREREAKQSQEARRRQRRNTTGTLRLRR